jgi:hypothetical protein
MNQVQEAQDFTSEHKTFAEKEGYKVHWHPYIKAWFITMPRKKRPGEKDQYFQNLSMAWEVAAIRAGRKIVKTKEEATRPRSIMQARYRGTKL